MNWIRRFWRGVVRRELLVLIVALILLCLALAGCGSKRESVQRHEEKAEKVAVTKTRTEKSTIAPDGTPFVEVTVTTQVLEEATRAEADTKINSTTTIVPPPILTVVAPIVTAGLGSLVPGGGVLLGLITAATTAWAAHKTSQAKAEHLRAEEHKADAKEGWDVALKSNPPSSPPKG